MGQRQVSPTAAVEIRPTRRHCVQSTADGRRGCRCASLGNLVEQSEIIHWEIEGSKLVVIEDAAHILNVAQLEVFNGTLQTFMDRY
jgi:hypothetical protein